MPAITFGGNKRTVSEVTCAPSADKQNGGSSRRTETSVPLQ